MDLDGEEGNIQIVQEGHLKTNCFNQVASIVDSCPPLPDSNDGELSEEEEVFVDAVEVLDGDIYRSCF